MGTITFANKAQVWLWEGEINGQISDGMWENSSPMNHYKAFWDADVRVGNPGLDGVYPKRTYDFANQELLSVVGDRMLFLGKAATAYPNAPDDSARAFQNVMEYKDELLKGAAKHDFVNKYAEKVMAAVGEDIQTIIKKVEAADYSQARMVTDLRQMSAVVNRRAGRKRKSPVAPEESEEQRPQILDGLTFCITGVFPEKRDIITQKLESLGALANGSVSRGTQLLIAGDKPGGDKTRAAQQLGTKTVGIEWLKETFAKGGVPFGEKAASVFRIKAALRRRVFEAQDRKVVYHLNRKHEWERVYENLRDVYDIIAAMGETKLLPEIKDAAATAKVQAQLWANPPAKSLDSTLPKNFGV